MNHYHAATCSRTHRDLRDASLDVSQSSTDVENSSPSSSDNESESPPPHYTRGSALPPSQRQTGRPIANHHNSEAEASTAHRFTRGGALPPERSDQGDSPRSYSPPPVYRSDDEPNDRHHYTRGSALPFLHQASKIRFQRVPSAIQDAINQYHEQATLALDQLSSVEVKDLELPGELLGCVFVGHTATDMDSIASAFAAAELFGGYAARASDINSETAFVLDYWHIPQPELLADVLETLSPETSVCLVDHNQVSQTAPHLPLDRVRGLIDHHAVQAGTVTTEQPIYTLIRPWGSACTIIAHLFMQANRAMTRRTAGLLMAGILSDTLNLRSPTTTSTDRLMLTLLAQIARVGDVDGFASLMFKAKSKQQANLSAYQLLTGDMKTFHFRDVSLAFGVVETVDLPSLVVRTPELYAEMRAFKKENALNYTFLALVDIVNLRSLLVVCGRAEQTLAEHVFGGTTDMHLLSVGRAVSRKKDFIAPISKALTSGSIAPLNIQEQQDELADVHPGEVYMDCTGQGCVVRRYPPITAAGHGHEIIPLGHFRLSPRRHRLHHHARSESAFHGDNTSELF